jgi:nucleoside-diphosphate-sugar epimerase
MVNLVFKYTGFYPKKIKFLSMPTGPINRAADISLAKKLLNWQPKYDFKTGLKKTIEWYFENKNKNFIKKNLKKLLI